MVDHAVRAHLLDQCNRVIARRTCHNGKACQFLGQRIPCPEKGAKTLLPDPLKSERDSLADTDAHGAESEGQVPVPELDCCGQCQPRS